MKKFQELNIELVESHERTIEILVSNLNDNWKRNIESEENLLSMSGTKQICIDYFGKEAVGSKIWLNKDKQRFCVINIIPKNKTQLSINEYNQAIELFAKEVLNPASLEYELSKADVMLEDLLSDESCKFRKFSRTANKSTGRANPSDEEKWLDFIYSTLKNGEYLALEDLRFFLQEDGWDEQTALELSLDYEYGYDAMKYTKAVG
ncbi:MAG: hypothetical protein GY749_40900 [Desulfobacteraceae bacterium]|nr:hypothetical protein [Desulfobacteraceae bacterium]